MQEGDNTMTGKIKNFCTFEFDEEATEIRGCAFPHTGNEHTMRINAIASITSLSIS